MEQGSYLLIEPGMTVEGTDGTIGTVAEVVADDNVDVFRGLVVSHGFLRKNVFVPAEQVVAVADSVVTLALSKEDADALPPASDNS